MDENDIKCDICGSTDTEIDNTEWSPFIIERIWGGEQKPANLIRCNSCGHSSVNPPPSEEELNKFYAGYRGKEYQEQRQKYEPLYTPQVNKNLGTIGYKSRYGNLNLILAININPSHIHTILDYGGDNGDAFPDILIDCKKYVYDVSNIPLSDGIHKINDLTQSDKLKFDYIQCCHTLEHCSNPDELIKNILKFAHINTIFYIELPHDVDINSYKVLFFIKHPIINKIISKLIRRHENRYRIMHEHINFFTEQSICILLGNNNLQVQYIKTINNNICCIATKHENSETFIPPNDQQ